MTTYEGIVIRLYPSAEADLVLRVITREVGKISLLARSARKSKKRFRNPLDLLDHGSFEVRPGKGSLLLVESFTPAPSLRQLREDLNKITAASVLCDCCDLLIHEAAEDTGEIFSTMTLALEAIDRSTSVRETLKALYFAVAHILNVSGYGTAQSEGAPSVNKLRKLLSFVEECAERKLESKSALSLVTDALKQEVHNAA